MSKKIFFSKSKYVLFLLYVYFYAFISNFCILLIFVFVSKLLHNVKIRLKLKEMCKSLDIESSIQYLLHKYNTAIHLF